VTERSSEAPSTSFVVAGEALFDLIEQPDGRLLPKPGGSPWNLARALGRLGRPVRYVNPLSSDSYGRQLAQALADSGVACTGGLSAAPTSLALVKLDAQGHPDYAFYREGVADRDLDPLALEAVAAQPGSLFHVGSLSLIPPDAAVWLALLRRLVARGVATSVDINMRPMVARDAAARAAYAAMAPELLAQGRIVKVSDEDLRAMGRTGEPLAEARALLGEVTSVVVLTLGAQGAWCLTGAGGHFQPAARVPVVDTVGAGDCFYAGFLARLDELGALPIIPLGSLAASTPQPPPAVPTPAAITDALAFANAAAALNLQRAGCEPPWRAEISL
jgi:fructokinase